MDSIQEIGPQYKKDNLFTAQMRFHQSWYRANILKLPYGFGPKKLSKNKFGNMLAEADGKKGKNLITEEIYILAKNRISQKTGAVDDYRLLYNMLSSMPMCFNLFGPLKNDLELASKLISALLPDEVSAVFLNSIQVQEKTILTINQLLISLLNSKLSTSI